MRRVGAFKFHSCNGAADAQSGHAIFCNSCCRLAIEATDASSIASALVRFLIHHESSTHANEEAVVGFSVENFSTLHWRGSLLCF